MPKNNQIIALSCSPSRGRNSDTMLDHFIKGINEVEGIEVEKIYLNDIPFDYYCYENGSQPGDNEQEFNDLARKIKEADALIISTPTYNFSVPAKLKNFIDRIRFIALDLSKKNKLGQPVGLLGHLRTYFIVSGGTPSWAQKMLFFGFPPFWLRSVFLYYGANCIGAYYSGDVKTFENVKILNKCRKKGSAYAKKVSKGKCNSLLEKIFWRPPQKD